MTRIPWTRRKPRIRLSRRPNGVEIGLDVSHAGVRLTHDGMGWLRGIFNAEGQGDPPRYDIDMLRGVVRGVPPEKVGAVLARIGEVLDDPAMTTLEPLLRPRWWWRFAT